MPPFAWQNNKAILFYFTQNSVSEIRLGTGAQRLSFGITFAATLNLTLPSSTCQLKPHLLLEALLVTLALVPTGARV